MALLALCAACASTDRTGPAVAVTAVREADSERVHFRRAARVDPPRRARLEHDAGSLADVTYSPDLRTVSVLWRDGAGELRCFFPLGGVGRHLAGSATAAPAPVEYVLLDEPGATVRMTLPLACPMRPALPLRWELDPVLLPARFEAGDTAIVIEETRGTVPLDLPRDKDGVLAATDVSCTLTTAAGEVLAFLVGIDPDGTPTATTGYVETGPHG